MMTERGNRLRELERAAHALRCSITPGDLLTVNDARVAEKLDRLATIHGEVLSLGAEDSTVEVDVTTFGDAEPKRVRAW